MVVPPVRRIQVLACLLVSRRVSGFHTLVANPCLRVRLSSFSTIDSVPSVPSSSSISAAASIDDDDHPFHSLETKQLLETAESAARAAGAIISKHLGCSNRPPESLQGSSSEGSQAASITTQKYSIKDVVTQYDKEAQAAVLDIIQSKYPNHAFLGEEDVGAGSQASEEALALRLDQSTSGRATSKNDNESGYLWICDPIDGTANFASGLPLCGVTLALVHHGTPVLGVIFDPHRDELFSAVRGQGATMNGAPIHVTDTITDVKDAIVNAGCPADVNAFASSMRGMLALNGCCRGLRIMACSAMTLPWIACGRLTAHFGYDLSSWDLVAGALIIQEAGGMVTDLDGSAYTLKTRNMLCSNGHVHDTILGVLKRADAVSFERAT